MTFKELLIKIKKDNQMENVARELHKLYYSSDPILEEISVDTVIKRVNQEVDSFLSLEVDEEQPKYKIAIVKTLRIYDDSYTYGYDSFLIDKAEEAYGYMHYALDMTDWKELISMEICEKSILRYGLLTCAMVLLFDSAFFGWNYEENNEARLALLDSLEEGVKELKEHPEVENHSDIKVLYEELGLTPPTEEEFEEYHKISQKEQAFYNGEILRVLGTENHASPCDAAILGIHKNDIDK